LRELSLHVLDLVENSLRAGATVIEVGVEEHTGDDRLIIWVQDNGPGLPVPPQQALDPFYTTKPGKKTGLGLSLFRFRLEQAGGGLQLGRSRLGGLEVRGEMGLSHVDRSPLGDLATTLSTVAACNPEVDVRCRLRREQKELNISSRELAEEMAGGGNVNPFIASREVYRKIKEGLEALRIKE
jgi:hypothetical protein